MFGSACGKAGSANVVRAMKTAVEPRMRRYRMVVPRGEWRSTCVECLRCHKGLKCLGCLGCLRCLRCFGDVMFSEAGVSVPLLARCVSCDERWSWRYLRHL